MPRFLKPTILFAVVSAVCFALRFAVKGGAVVFLSVGYTAAVLAFIFLVMTAVALIQRVLGRKETSPWKIFAVCDIVLMLASLLIGLLFDNPYTHGENIGEGWLGAILLRGGLPMLGGLLLIELLAYKVIKSKKEDSNEQSADFPDK